MTGPRRGIKYLGNFAVDEVNNIFWSHVEKTNGCWFWRGTITPSGYGVFWNSINQKPVMVHRFSYEFSFGKIPKGHDVHHTCKSSNCVRPTHLAEIEISSHRLLHRAKAISQCVNGHPFTEEITSFDEKGYPRCRICRNEQNRRHQKKKRMELAR